MFLSYLHLLVNTRSELALARVINTPNRDLCPKAFDAIKKHAKARNMPMYQVGNILSNCENVKYNLFLPKMQIK